MAVDSVGRSHKVHQAPRDSDSLLLVQHLAHRGMGLGEGGWGCHNHLINRDPGMSGNQATERQVFPLRALLQTPPLLPSFSLLQISFDGELKINYGPVSAPAALWSGWESPLGREGSLSSCHGPGLGRAQDCGLEFASLKSLPTWINEPLLK